MSKKSLPAELADLFEDYDNLRLSESITGMTDACELAQFINKFCVAYLGSPAAEYIYAGLSVGASFGLKLQNAQEVFIKMNRVEPGETMATALQSLHAVSHVQNHLHSIHFPCPYVILPPVFYDGTITTVYEYAAIGIQQNAHDPAIRSEMAAKFAELTRLADRHKTLPGLRLIDPYATESLYSTPHNVLFDFSTSGQNTSWIDEIALRSKKIIHAAEKNIILGHSDWSMKNMRFVGTNIAIIYDWDSLILSDEYHLLGIAASTFPTTWDIPVKITPSQDEAHAFVAEYEKARGKRFSKKEWLKISACATYTICYTARCELSIDPNGVNYQGSYRQALREMEEKSYLGI